LGGFHDISFALLPLLLGTELSVCLSSF